MKTIECYNIFHDAPEDKSNITNRSPLNSIIIVFLSNIITTNKWRIKRKGCTSTTPNEQSITVQRRFEYPQSIR